MTTIVDIYCRVSTDDQENNTSLEEQERCCREYCRENGLIVGEVWHETKSGALLRERVKFSKMRKRYMEGKIQGIVFRTVDRWSRKQEHIAILLEESSHHNIQLHCVKEKIEDTAMGKFALMVLAFFAEMEREKTLDRTSTGRIAKAKEGKVPPVAKVPYGRRWVYAEKNGRMVHDRIEIVEEEAAVLRKAAEEYADGISLNSIVNKLNREGVPAANGGIWYPSTMLRLIVDPRITGRNLTAFTTTRAKAKTRLGAVALPDGTYPQIISVELHQRVVARCKYNTEASPRKSKEPEMFLLRSGYARCKYCGNAMATYTIRRPGKNNQYVYRCQTRGSECFGRVISAPLLDKEVWGMVTLAADYQPLIEQSIALAMKQDLAASDLASVERAIVTCKGRIENYQDDLNDTNLRGDTRAGIRQLLNSQHELLETLETERAKLMSHAIDKEKQDAVYAKLLAWCRKAKHERESLTYIEKRNFFDLLGLTVFTGSRPDRYHPLDWDAKVRLPELEAVLHDIDFCISSSQEQP